MAEMISILETIAYLTEFRTQIAGDLEAFESGKMATFDITDKGRTDTTAKTIAELKRRLAYTDKIIAAYQAHLKKS